MPDWVNIVVIFHAFTGLQCRLQDYLYLVAYLVFSVGAGTGPLRGGLRRFVIRFCRTYYRRAGHLNILSGVPPVSPAGSIDPEIYPGRIEQEWLLNFSFGVILGDSVHFSGPAGWLSLSSRKWLIVSRNAQSAERERSLFDGTHERCGGWEWGRCPQEGRVTGITCCGNISQILESESGSAVVEGLRGSPP
jgi:hypothetical protein